MNMHQVTVLFFATLRDRAGTRSVQLEIPPRTSVSALKALLLETYPSLSSLMGHTLVSLNHEYVFDETIVPNHAEIALFPPVSGG